MVAINLPSPNRTPKPLLPTVTAMRRADAEGRKIHHVLRVAEHHLGDATRRTRPPAAAFAPTAAHAAPNRKQKTTIWSTSPRAIASMMLAGNVCSRIDATLAWVCGNGGFRGGTARRRMPVAGPHQVHRAQARGTARTW